MFRSAAILSTLCFCIFKNAYSQKINDGFSNYHREWLVGIGFNTNGGIPGSVMGKYSLRYKQGVYHAFLLEIANIRHPKEIRAQSDSTQSFYIRRKQNHLFSIRLKYGVDKILFESSKDSELQVNGILVGGPTFGIVKPYFLRYGENQEEAEIVPYSDQTTDPAKTYGNGGLLTGFDQATLVPGLNAQASLSFEFGTFFGSVTGIEAGFTFEWFPQKIIIVEDENDTRLFTSAFVMFFFGDRK